MTRTHAPHGRGRWLAPVLLLAAGCAAEPAADPGAAAPAPFADCATLTAAPRAAAVSSPPATNAPAANAPAANAPAANAPAADAPAANAPAADPAPGDSAPAAQAGTAGLPDVTVPCFAGGQPVRLAELPGPAVLNLWASSCAPCRDELPAVQRLAERTAGRLHVVGVDTGDLRDAAASFGADAGVTFPTLYDRDRRLLQAVGKRALPVTIFLDPSGRRYVYNGRSLDDARLTALVSEHTGVVVEP